MFEDLYDLDAINEASCDSFSIFGLATLADYDLRDELNSLLDLPLGSDNHAVGAAREVLPPGITRRYGKYVVRIATQRSVRETHMFDCVEEALRFKVEVRARRRLERHGSEEGPHKCLRCKASGPFKRVTDRFCSPCRIKKNAAEVARRRALGRPARVYCAARPVD